MSAATARHHALLTGAVAKGKTTHPALELVVIDLRPPSAIPTISAAGIGSIYVGPLSCHHVWVDKGGPSTRYAIRQEHLATLANLCPKSSYLTLEADESELTAEIVAESGALIGTWTLPLAGRRDLDAFPDEPSTLAVTATGYVWDALDVRDAAHQLAPFASMVCQADHNELRTATWAGAAQTQLDAGPADKPVSLPASALPVLARMGTAGPRIVLGETEGWLHFVQDSPETRATLHVAKLTAATDDIGRTFFHGMDSRPDAALRIPGDAVTRAVERASALSTHVRLLVRDGSLVIEAADGSSTQSVVASWIGSRVPTDEATVYETATLLSALSRMDSPSDFRLALPLTPNGLAYLSTRRADFALVPMADAP